MNSATLALSVTTQGPLYPPSEIMNADGDFIVVGRVACADASLPWRGAIVSGKTVAPPFNQSGVHAVLRWFDVDDPQEVGDAVLHTLPLPLPANNYPMLFAPQQRPQAHTERRPSFALHQAPVPDLREADGRRRREPITLAQWLRARGTLRVSIEADRRGALFELACEQLVPDSVYTVMSLRERDLDPVSPTRPGPLGVPNVFVTDASGKASFWARLPNPFPAPGQAGANRVVNIVVLYMSSHMCHGGAIGWYGLGGDIHAQLKLQAPSFAQFTTED